VRSEVKGEVAAGRRRTRTEHKHPPQPATVRLALNFATNHQVARLQISVQIKSVLKPALKPPARALAIIADYPETPEDTPI
jgi:hypothetical protein